MSKSEIPAGAEIAPQDEQEPQSPACVMSFNASEPSGASGLAGDIATIAAMGAHCLPVVTAVLLRDTAEVFDQHVLDSDTVVEQARSILEDVTITAWKVGFLGSAEGVSAVAEVLSDYPDVPLVAYMPSISWLDEEQQQSYLDAFRELVLPQTSILVGNHKTLSDFLLPDWDSERPASARELAVAAGQHGTAVVLVTGISLPNQFIDNVLASPQGPITGEKFERFETSFIGAGDTLSASLASLLAVGVEAHEAVAEALAFLDQSLDAGFRPGMGNVVPDRFFWALPPEGEDAEQLAAENPLAFAAAETDDEEEEDEAPAEAPARSPRRMH
ncbi:bifunctional hydroxymethylpyrimidine kinase/phosphomethylpyrimidine kinase [Pelomonas sp. SE-A7]|uniref:bifunctional hydroxymethylpyrimidine kinase/phosphomethylpyrimidine kinase n=1 Tax=Pelomonas sp. SE-A7 TaxID=3054953 RepID=UPI00259C922B|nr:bifunctional hydroxymethylpyrimidine kinase/phosphomethylpyrimidine kinase [Pelomonas sp. SE-A7]MDM4767627.1 bifunctional hydroxymethylpyrimidine kinase/phosphomethylpyrimidine kinase [Pelomonas sp. SE-A7]